MFQSFSQLNQWIMRHPTDRVKVSLQRLLSSGAGAEGVMRGIPADYARRYALVQRLKYASDGTPTDLTPEEQQTVAENTIAAARAELEDIKSTVDAIQPFPLDEPIEVSGVKQYHWKGVRRSESYPNPIATLEILEGAGTSIPTVRVTIKPQSVIGWSNGSSTLIDGAKGVTASVTYVAPGAVPFIQGRTALYSIGNGYFNGWNVEAYALASDLGVTVILVSYYNTHEPGELSQHYSIAISDMQADTATVNATTGLHEYAQEHIFERPAQLDAPYSGWEYFPTLTSFGQALAAVGTFTKAASVMSNTEAQPAASISTAAGIVSLVNALAYPICYGGFATEDSTLDVWGWIRSKIDRTASALEVLEQMPIQ